MGKTPDKIPTVTAVSQKTPPMEARLVDHLSEGEGWQYEPSGKAERREPAGLLVN